MDDVTELYVLDEAFQILDLLDGFITLIWNKKYYGVGSFELHCGVEYARLLQAGSYIYRKDDTDTGIIEEFGYSNDTSYGKKVVVKGRFLKAKLENRVIDTAQNFSNQAAGAVLCQLVQTYCISPGDTERVIPKLTIAGGSELGNSITTQITGETLLDAMEKICEEQELSCQIGYDFLTDRLLFRVWQGMDRTQGQTVNNFATFNEEFDNISGVEYNLERGYKNFAYVAGAGEGAERIIETVDIRKDGEERRELYVDARDLQPTDGDGNAISEATYRQTLRQRGLEKLSDYQMKETIDTKVDSNNGFVYGVDYSLGDLVTFVDNEVGIVAEQRVTEIYEYIEEGERRIDAVFGQSKLNVMEKIKKGVV